MAKQEKMVDIVVPVYPVLKMCYQTHCFFGRGLKGLKADKVTSHGGNTLHTKNAGDDA